MPGYQPSPKHGYKMRMCLGGDAKGRMLTSPELDDHYPQVACFRRIVMDDGQEYRALRFVILSVTPQPAQLQGQLEAFHELVAPVIEGGRGGR